MNAILERARRALADRAELEIDLQEREANDRTIPALPVDRREMIFKERQNSRVMTAPDWEVTAPPAVAPAAADEGEVTWLNAMDEFSRAVVERFAVDRERIERLEQEIEALRAELAASRKPKQSRAGEKKLTEIPGPFLRLGGPHAN